VSFEFTMATVTRANGAFEVESMTLPFNDARFCARMVRGNNNRIDRVRSLFIGVTCRSTR
jgi:hypothetical protein